MTEQRAVEAGTAIKALARAAYEYLASYGSLLLFALLCLVWSLLALPLSALLPPTLGRRLGRLGILGGFRLYAHWLRRVGAYRELERYFRSELQPRSSWCR
ncbi:MAG: hypothetical protein WB646_10455 [Steroidobacteraceae bacterium]